MKFIYQPSDWDLARSSTYQWNPWIIFELEKTKAGMSEVSQSVCALSLEDMYHLYVACFDLNLTDG